MFGHRVDGKRLKHLDPIIQITPYLMPMRCDAQVFLQHKLDYEKLALQWTSRRQRRCYRSFKGDSHCTLYPAAQRQGGNPS